MSFANFEESYIKALRRTGAGLNLVEFHKENSENFNIVKAYDGRQEDQIIALQDGSEVKI